MRLAQHLRRLGVEVFHTTEMPLGNRTPDDEIKRVSAKQAGYNLAGNGGYAKTDWI